MKIAQEKNKSRVKDNQIEDVEMNPDGEEEHYLSRNRRN